MRRQKSEQQRKGEEERRQYKRVQDALLREGKGLAMEGRRQRRRSEDDDDEGEQHQQQKTKTAAETEGDERAIRGGVTGAVVDEETGEIARVVYEEDDGTVRSEGGVTIEPFNLRKEREEGYFDRTGSYTEYKRNAGDKDAWLDEEYDKVYAPKLERESKEPKLPIGRREDDDKGDDGDDDDGTDGNGGESGGETLDMSAALARAAELMRGSETVADALRRIGGKGAGFADLSDAADALVQGGVVGVYGETRLELLRRLAAVESAKPKRQRSDDANQQQTASKKPRATAEDSGDGTGPQQQQPAPQPQQTTTSGDGANVMWEYKTTASDEIFGPFTSQQMAEWKRMGFFGTGDYAAMVRRVHKSDADLFATEDTNGTEEQFVDAVTVNF